MDYDEYTRLYDEFVAAVEHASKVLRKKGMESEEFREADAAAGKLAIRLGVLRRKATKPVED